MRLAREVLAGTVILGKEVRVGEGRKTTQKLHCHHQSDLIYGWEHGAKNSTTLLQKNKTKQYYVAANSNVTFPQNKVTLPRIPLSKERNEKVDTIVIPTTHW